MNIDEYWILILNIGEYWLTFYEYWSLFLTSKWNHIRKQIRNQRSHAVGPDSGD